MHTRLTLLRNHLINKGLHGLLIPRTDEFQNEYLASYADRLPWLCGFDGSAGLAVVLQQAAALFVDGRYITEARARLDPSIWEVYNTKDLSASEWLTTKVIKGNQIGFDPWLHTLRQITPLKDACEDQGGTLIPLVTNLIDELWKDKPEKPLGLAQCHPLIYSGQESTEKRQLVSKTLQEHALEAFILTKLESIAWLLNIRGTDFPHTPFVLAQAIIRQDGTVEFYIDTRKSSPELEQWLGPQVHLRELSEFSTNLKALQGHKIGVDKTTAPYAVVTSLEDYGAILSFLADPCALPQALKNPVEIKGARECHLRDGAALSTFLAWIDTQITTGTAVTEIEAAEKLAALRSEQDLFKDLSFTTISATGPHGAIIHYKPTVASNTQIQKNELYLLDSGGQYLDGTTDVTRTIAFSAPTAQQKSHFTRVLKGHIALARAVFPEGTTGHALDILARQALWQDCLDYDHGTGHGVGSYLSVHEGPQSISSHYNDTKLAPGMILSNEPGFYLEGHYGIRIESLLVVVPVKAHANEFSKKRWFRFDTLTCAPIDRRLIEYSLLTNDEKEWLNNYHAQIQEQLSRRVSAETKAWLKQATQKI